ncbi:hypothetical protein A2645_01405 [Candidatus Nomurabacteria bacterium RIFCSPHIGHO2_01_FULL_39_9]|uniref:Uncharacterized protein n=1 Tax=Candidatus Nomurabacteria bacterium RIFCSPHIGHO2_01_FULL_39_9 TaxID=1801735 RepID=A0A1F6UXT7_9BACT|nr:MAG: hypothetical protein A2645_01405 [Candidatus Nomurabacteria bacterium RIFCSPHIGHO2_01_FULL_39_9]
MDIFAHALWANAGARKLNQIADKKGNQKFSIAWTTFWGIFPDLFAFSWPFALRIFAVLSGSLALSNFFQRPPIAEESAFQNGFAVVGNLYPYSHSLIIFAAVFLIVWLIYRRPRFELLGWGLHILIDIFSHSIQFYPTPFLFPISDWRFPYGVAWSGQIFMIINYSLLLIVFLYFAISKIRRKNNARSNKVQDL